MTSPTATAEIERLAREATKGPWGYEEGITPFYNDADGYSCGGDGTGYCEIYQLDENNNALWNEHGEPVFVDVFSVPNAAYIAAVSPDVVLGILAALRAAEAERDEARAALEAWTTTPIMAAYYNWSVAAQYDPDTLQAARKTHAALQSTAAPQRQERT